MRPPQERIVRIPGYHTMSKQAVRALAFSAFAAITLSSLSPQAEAGGFAVREQSTSAQGSSFAGSAAGFDLSSMYWNPAAVTVKDGVNSESHAAIIIGQSEYTATGGTVTALSASNSSGNVAMPAFVTTSYANYQFGDLYLGLSLNAPFGLTTKPDDPWVGQPLGRTSKLLTINGTPTVGYKIMPGVSVAAGVQVQYIKAKLSSVLTGFSARNTLTVEGDDIGFGYTAGILLEPTDGTKLGLGFRSSVSHKLKGDQTSDLGRSDITAAVDLPEIVTLSLRQRVTNRLTFLGTAEWTNWSRVKSIAIKCAVTDASCGQAGETLSSLDLNYQDGWFFSGGVEYATSPNLLLRTGIAYEISPARQDTSRTVRIADNDRIWASIGATYKLFANTELDFAYTHIFVKDGGIDQSAAGLTLTANAESSVDIVSASLKVKW